MSLIRNAVIALGSLSSLVSAVPANGILDARNVTNSNSSSTACGLVNPVVTSLGSPASATAFCSSFFSISTQTFTETSTVTKISNATTTLATGTDVITDPTATSTVVSIVTTTSVVYTTSDDSFTPTVRRRDAKPTKKSCGKVTIPTPLTMLMPAEVSSACSCLSIPTPSVTTTEIETTTLSLTSTASTYANTTTFTPYAYTTTTATETATSTSTILKSDVLSTAVAIINQDNEQPFCSSILGYTTPVTTAYETATATTVLTESSTVTITNYATITTTAVIINNKKRAPTPITTVDSGAAASIETPTALASYPAEFVTSACSMAVTSPAASTVSSTVTVTETQTSVTVATETAQATTVVTKACAKYPLANGGFEQGSFSSWSPYNPIGGAGGAWSIVSGGDAGNYAAQVTMKNPDTSKYGGFAGFISQTFDTCVGFSYTVQYRYDCTTVNNGLAIYSWAGNGNSGQFVCPSQGAWYSASFTFTATSASTTLYIEGVQNGVTQGVIKFDSVAVTLNQ
ncbi:hypothetical protein PFICI_11295 [Pestalotiopsis fici W106-1]|uniref:CBM-cenC domain-containing protein n=1 Tax=Pestalotiopsis fici (strain W106-1 / CGMCC3.15140) TaxID=1229662 RepID=W3WX26_PESFW|nr:uncharacterized protein PFICI_11295 [Pestalotiopsis fici W106-1]ETS77421.1 hypothetical protein PFICI_11295 [Pestalotiopsis fici W106-1]